MLVTGFFAPTEVTHTSAFSADNSPRIAVEESHVIFALKISRRRLFMLVIVLLTNNRKPFFPSTVDAWLEN